MAFKTEEILAEFSSYERDMTWELAVQRRYIAVKARLNLSDQTRARELARLARRRRAPGYKAKHAAYMKQWSDNVEYKAKRREYMKAWRAKNPRTK